MTIVKINSRVCGLRTRIVSGKTIVSTIKCMEVECGLALLVAVSIQFDS